MSNIVSRDTIAMMEFEVNKKNLFVAYFFWFFFGWLGAHRFYLRKTNSAQTMFGISLASFLMKLIVLASAYSTSPQNEIFIFDIMGIVGFIIIAIWWIGDAFFLAGLVGQHNQELIDEIRK